MDPRKAKHRITFLTANDATDGDGFNIHDPKPYVTVWAELRTLKGRTFYSAAQNNMQHNREFILRYHQALNERNRPRKLTLLWQGIEHEIESIEDDDGLRKTMTVVAKAVT
ncbi:phage head closure protein [Bacillus sp. A301a_S52]|nr:phage head closure protein [Bacillus sp. A301a_S52]